MQSLNVIILNIIANIKQKLQFTIQMMDTSSGNC
jgi:hypothetical protein